MFKAVMQRNLLGQNGGVGGGGGRTLVELAQARAGVVSQAQRIEKGIGEEGRKENFSRERERERDVPVWDPERDEMPSPFLVKGGGREVIRRL